MTYFELISEYKLYKDKLKYHKVKKIVFEPEDTIFDRLAKENEQSVGVITGTVVCFIIPGILFWYLGMGIRGLVQYSILALSIIGGLAIRKLAHKKIRYTEDNDCVLVNWITIRRGVLAVIAPILAPYLIAYFEGSGLAAISYDMVVNELDTTFRPFMTMIKWMLIALIVSAIYLIWVLRKYMIFRKLYKFKKDNEIDMEESIMPTKVFELPIKWYHGWISSILIVMAVSFISALIGVFTTFKL